MAAEIQLEERLTALSILTAIHHGLDEEAVRIAAEAAEEDRLPGVVAALTGLALIAYRALAQSWGTDTEEIMQRMGLVMSIED